MWWSKEVLRPIKFGEVVRYIDNQFFMHVATISNKGNLHNAPCNFIRINDKIYFDGDKTSVKIQNMKGNGKVCIVWSSGKPFFDSRGVIMQGRARIVNDPNLEKEDGRALKILYTQWSGSI
jgi:nitroimidazol reductase NimA-like FMN-containing flavoprotein (pyridoxamine 5'-phosphate oxidase superfamily)